jgi:hypothetical protein
MDPMLGGNEWKEENEEGARDVNQCQDSAEIRTLKKGEDGLGRIKSGEMGYETSEGVDSKMDPYQSVKNEVQEQQELSMSLRQEQYRGRSKEYVELQDEPAGEGAAVEESFKESVSAKGQNEEEESFEKEVEYQEYGRFQASCDDKCSDTCIEPIFSTVGLDDPSYGAEGLLVWGGSTAIEPRLSEDNLYKHYKYFNVDTKKSWRERFGQDVEHPGIKVVGGKYDWVCGQYNEEDKYWYSIKDEEKVEAEDVCRRKGEEGYKTEIWSESDDGDGDMDKTEDEREKEDEDENENKGEGEDKKEKEDKDENKTKGENEHEDGGEDGDEDLLWPKGMHNKNRDEEYQHLFGSEGMYRLKRNEEGDNTLCDNCNGLPLPNKISIVRIKDGDKPESESKSIVVLIRIECEPYKEEDYKVLNEGVEEKPEPPETTTRKKQQFIYNIPINLSISQKPYRIISKLDDQRKNISFRLINYDQRAEGKRSSSSPLASEIAKGVALFKLTNYREMFYNWKIVVEGKW